MSRRGDSGRGESTTETRTGNTIRRGHGAGGGRRTRTRIEDTIPREGRDIEDMNGESLAQKTTRAGKRVGGERTLRAARDAARRDTRRRMPDTILRILPRKGNDGNAELTRRRMTMTTNRDTRKGHGSITGGRNRDTSVGLSPRRAEGTPLSEAVRSAGPPPAATIPSTRKRRDHTPRAGGHGQTGRGRGGTRRRSDVRAHTHTHTPTHTHTSTYPRHSLFGTPKVFLLTLL